jgi:hypothetical protein
MTFVQHNYGNAKGVQIFSSTEKDKFVQIGGGVQIIDGVENYTQNSKTDNKSNSKFVQNNYGSNFDNNKPNTK